ncbi:MAG: hypothetical protein HYZ28_01395 [Myxococcales bacterium]|nr:hypothetical protein [Myxococcales bacterium]
MFDRDCPEGLRCVNRQCLVWEEPDSGAKVRTKRFGEPCGAPEECQSGQCVPAPQGRFCTVSCAEGPCPTGLSCKLITGADGGPPSPMCAVPQPLLCQACAQDEDCGATLADMCLTFGNGRFCGQDCSRAPCPEGYSCNEVTPGRVQCMPTFKTCDCSPKTLGLAKGCQSSNDAGSCYGAEVCQADGGFTACTAKSAKPEACNGVDDDCDGLIDDLPARPCARSSSFGICTGDESCKSEAWVCDAPLPGPEKCDLSDNDCDGAADEDYKDSAGRYVAREHCGGCGLDCLKLISLATAAQCYLDATGASACRATACQTGYFPYADGGVCLKLPDTLCRPCAVDSDCVGPGSACLNLGKERVCGRSCGPSSPYGGCPAGYSCRTWDGGQQCAPVSSTCECSLSRLGSARGCSISTCSGYQLCALDGGTPAWSACDVASYNPEICDAVDNNCDGRVDEGFRNPSTGKYDAVQSCGFCNNDCSKYWSPALQHTTGICDSAPAMPLCRMGPCATEVDGGVTYEWMDVNKDTADGCECRRVQGNTASDVPDRQPTGGSYVDENCDGVDGVISDALFVSAAAPLGGTGTLTSPLRTIGSALGALPASGKKYILVAEGIYRENLLLFSGAQVFGGYSADFRKRDPLLHTSSIVGQAPSGASFGPLAAVHAQSIAAATPETAVSGFTIFGYDVPQSTLDDRNGEPSYAVYLRDCGPGVVIVNNDIFGGRGGVGGRGSNGAQGFGRQSSLLLDGRTGLSSGRAAGNCVAGFMRLGGIGGTNASCPAANATRGGNGVCPVFNWSSTPVEGNQQEYLAPDGGLSGRGGWDWSFDLLSGFSCSHVTESGFPSNIQDHDGRDGLAGADGQHGQGGAGAAASARNGSIASGRWVPSPFSARVGTAGLHAKGGGGGGAGGGTARHPSTQCPSHEYGATGGGAGGGGCGGAGAMPGGAGGASLAIFASFSSATVAAQAPRIERNRIHRGSGGVGGNGGFGGAGGLGGTGGAAGGSTTWSGSVGGKGGEGGNGGAGGGGGGGAGGPSFGILGFNFDVSGWRTLNSFLTSSTSSTGGQGGAGGSSAGAGATGTAGTSGAYSDATSLYSCTAPCPPSAVCDANGACVPL